MFYSVRAISSREKYDESLKDFRLRIGHLSLSQISMIFITRNLLSTTAPLVFWTIYWAQKHDKYYNQTRIRQEQAQEFEN